MAINDGSILRRRERSAGSRETPNFHDGAEEHGQADAIADPNVGIDRFVGQLRLLDYLSVVI